MFPYYQAVGWDMAWHGKRTGQTNCHVTQG